MTECSKIISLVQYRLAGEVKEYIRACIAAGHVHFLSIDLLCIRFAVNENILMRSFKQRYATTIRSFIIGEKMRVAQSLLLGGSLSIKEVAYLIGYSEPANFSRDFSRVVGMPPNEFRQCKTSAILEVENAFSLQ